MLVDVTEVEVAGRHRLHLRFADGTAGEIDVSKLVEWSRITMGVVIRFHCAACVPMRHKPQRNSAELVPTRRKNTECNFEPVGREFKSLRARLFFRGLADLGREDAGASVPTVCQSGDLVSLDTLAVWVCRIRKSLPLSLRDGRSSDTRPTPTGHVF